MSGILIDTNAYASFKRGDAEAVRIIQNAGTLALNAVVIGELLAGFAVGTREGRNREELRQFIQSDRVLVLPIDDRTAQFYATVYRNLRQKGQLIPTNDLWIAASALQHGLAVFTHDGHFAHVDGVTSGNSVTSLGIG